MRHSNTQIRQMVSQGILGDVVLNSCLNVEGWGGSHLPYQACPATPHPLYPTVLLTLSQALPHMPGLIRHARSVCEVELLVWG